LTLKPPNRIEVGLAALPVPVVCADSSADAAAARGGTECPSVWVGDTFYWWLRVFRRIAGVQWSTGIKGTYRIASIDANLYVSAMRTTLNLDESLLAEAQRLTGMRERTALVHEGLKALIERENARRLGRLGGSEPRLRPAPRRRSRPA